MAQDIAIQGIVKDAKEKLPVIGATVSVINPSDSTLIAGEITDLDGSFKFSGIREGSYVVKISFLGYQTLTKNINSEGDVDFGVMEMQLATQVLDEIVVEAEVVTGEQRGDTVAFNAAAFTTLKDASTQELITKMPGIAVIDGQIQTNGEAIQRILVDGQEFFGGDVQTALQSLPAEMVKSVEIYDQKSDKARLSGFDDGEEVKAINIVTKASKKVGQFGKMTGGYGTDDRYQGAASVNFFNDQQRATVTGLSNNINAVSYSAEPNSQGEERTQDGVINTNSINLQYSNKWSNGLLLSASYGYSDRRNEAEGIIFRDYILPSQEDQVYSERNSDIQTDKDHRFRMRLEYDLTPKDKLIFVPEFRLNYNIAEYNFRGQTFEGQDPLNESNTTNSSNNYDNDYESRLTYNHRFDKEGRSITLYTQGDYHNNLDNARRIAQNIYYDGVVAEAENLNQRIERLRNGVGFSAGGSYTEPVHENGMIELEYSMRNRLNDSDLLNYNVLEENPDGNMESLDTALSNVFENSYLTNEVELGYQYKIENLSVQAEVEYQRADLVNNQEFPFASNLQRTFNSILPSFRLDYNISENKNLQVNYFSWTREPRIGDLQEVIDNSNPLRLRTGNPNLDQEFNHRVRARYRFRNREKERNLYIGMNASIIGNAVTNTTFIADEATEVANGIILSKGGQLVRPENVSGNWSVRSFINYGLPVPVIKSNFNAWTGIGYRQRPGIVNDQKTFTNSTDLRLGLNLSSNISDRIDFNISTRSNYSIVDNSNKPELNNNYFRHSTRVRLNSILWKGITFRVNATHEFFEGLSEDLDNSFFLVNMSLGKKILPNERGEISLRVYDLFGQNNNIDRNVTELFIEDRERTVLQRYFMLSFTYNLRHFSTGYSLDDFDTGGQDDDRRGRRRRY